ncbi:MAG: hypothetical protein D6706_08370 [Chloroflexi bacterium]|nr:MAG: hypothetical protein D6706_08370 [Chloroflexota bacterium]
MQTNPIPRLPLSRQLKLIATLPVAFFLMLVLHELGHTIFARLLGDQTAVFYLYRRFENGGFCIGCNIYNAEALSSSALLLVSLAGLLFTQLIAIGLLYLRRHAQNPSFLHQVTSIWLAVFVLDMPTQLLQIFQVDPARVNRLTNIDLVDTVYIIWQTTGFPVLLTRFVVLGLGVLYLTWVIREARKPQKTN